MHLPPYTKVSLAEERALVVRAKAGDAAARAELVRSNLQYIQTIARKFGRRAPAGLTEDDLVGVGVLGFYRAIEYFDTDKTWDDARLTQYACWWITGHISREVLKHRSIFTAPEKACRLARKSGKYPFLRSRPAEPVYKDGPPLYEFVPSDAAALDDALGAARLPSSVRSAVKRVKMTDREKVIFRTRLLQASGEEASLRALGAEFQVSKERVRQLELGLVKKLRAALGGVWAAL